MEVRPDFPVLIILKVAIPFIAIIHYYGNGQKNTGDWCFKDGFITFRDIADLHMKYGRGRILTVVTDCHSSGRWVSQCG